MTHAAETQSPEHLAWLHEHAEVTRPHAAGTLADARINCSPQSLQGPELARFWVETNGARDEFTSFRTNLGDILDKEGSPKVLIHGHYGCGKSTELNKFIAGLRPQWLAVLLRAGDYIQTSGNEAADVLLAVCIRIIEVAQEKTLRIDDKLLGAVIRFFDETTETRTDSRTSTLGLEGGVDASEGLWGRLLGLKLELIAALKFDSRTEQSTVHRVRKRKGELCLAVNALGIAVEKAWQTQAKDPQARLLLVIEDLDKLGLADARQIFVHDGRILSEVALRAVYTIPVFTFHSADAGAIRGHFKDSLPLPMIKVFGPQGDRCAAGWDVLADIVRARVAPAVLPSDALVRLIERTGGVLRDLFEAIQIAALFNTVRADQVIGRAAIDQALDRMITRLGLQIAYPPEDKRDPKPLQEKLAAIAQGQATGRTITAQPDPDIQLLLMSGALLEYNGEGWLGVHPLARQYLQKLGLDVGPLPA